jgi:hypothetical protein
MNENNKRYSYTKVPPGTTPQHVSFVVLETNPRVKKFVTKRYPDCRPMSILLVDEKSDCGEEYHLLVALAL